MPDRLETLRDVVEPVLAPLGLGIYDLVAAGDVVRVTVDRPGGVDIDTIEAATRAIGPVLDEADVPGPFTLEVSSPGLERTLRRPEHFGSAVGSLVSVKARDAEGATERLRGELTAADADTITIRLDDGDRTVALDAITSARTVFEWGPAPKPGKGSKPGHAKKETVARP